MLYFEGTSRKMRVPPRKYSRKMQPMRKNAHIMRANALALNEIIVPSDAACWKIQSRICSNKFSNIPPKLRSLNAAYA